MHAIVISGGDLYAGGFFTTAGGITANRIAKWDKTTGISTISGTTPAVYSLSQNYPNPFNPETTIKFSLPKNSFVTLKIYDIAGREVAALVNQKLNSGTFEYKFDASKLTSGIYLYRISTKEFTETKRMMLLK